MKTIKIGGVPEHFNLPWHLCLEDKTFQKQGLEVHWKDFPEGTGAMCKSLRNKELDIAVILTEGIIKDIIDGSKVRIIQEYIASPLIWSVHVAAESPYKDLKDLKKAKVAISRFGSGSHLMACVHAKNLGWDPKELEFVVVNDIEGAVEALTSGEAGYFLWEHFTTKPLVDQGTFRRLGDCPTPWPCFVIAAREDFIKENSKAVRSILDIINKTTLKFKEIPAVEKLLVRKYHQKQEDIALWLSLTTWSQKQISVLEIDKVQKELYQLNLIPQKIDNAVIMNHFIK